ncbi:MAG TPA: hypothetical protein VK116_00875, partial [Planctomycetota bacterium]|nr:hypothetical protein [Planctomycetota bacterium]
MWHRPFSKVDRASGSRLVAIIGAVLLATSGASLVRAQEQGDGEWQPGLVALYRSGEHEVAEIVPVPRAELGPMESLHPAIAPSFSAEWR